MRVAVGSFPDLAGSNFAYDADISYSKLAIGVAGFKSHMRSNLANNVNSEDIIIAWCLRFGECFMT